MNRSIRTALFTLFTALCVGGFATQSASAASGEMGAGLPHFGFYTSEIRVWSIANPAPNFPAGCSSLVIRPATIGPDLYKTAIATLLTSKAAGLRVRFYAHSELDGGCGIDYIELQP